MRFFLLISAAILAGCSSAYKNLLPAESDPACLQKFKPAFTTNWYEANVDVAGNHISGLMLFKLMPDSSLRIAFTSKSGLKFLDFEFSKTGEFIPHFVIDKLDKKVIINTLKADFEIMMMLSMEKWPILSYSESEFYYFAVPLSGHEADYYVTSKDCTNLVRLERGGRRKVLEAFFADYFEGVPGEITVNHTTFDMKLSLIKLKVDNADQ